MSEVLLYELEKKNNCILILNGFLKKRPINGLYLNFIDEEDNKTEDMFNILCSNPIQTLFDMFVYLLYQLNYFAENIYIPAIDGESVVSLFDVREKNVFGSLESLFADFKEKARKRDKTEIIFGEYLPMVQVLAYDDHIKLSLVDYVTLHPELMELFEDRLRSVYYSVRDFFDDGYARRIKSILLTPVKNFKKDFHVGCCKS